MEETWVITDTLLNTSFDLDTSFDLSDDDSYYVPTPSSSPTQTEVEPTSSHSPTEVEPTPSQSPTELEPTPSQIPTEVELTEEERQQPRPPMRGPCGSQCRRKCTDHISDDRRKEIWRQYWDMAYTERRTWMFHSATSLETVLQAVDVAVHSATCYKIREESQDVSAR